MGSGVVGSGVRGVVGFWGRRPFILPRVFQLPFAVEALTLLSINQLPLIDNVFFEIWIFERFFFEQVYWSI